MLLVDSSVWIDILRGDVPGHRIRLLRASADDWVTSEPILAEVLAGTRHPEHTERQLSAIPLRPCEAGPDFRSAAAIFRACQRTGRTPRSLIDCLIAAVALRHGDVVAHRDADFELIAEVSALRTLDLR